MVRNTKRSWILAQVLHVAFDARNLPLPEHDGSVIGVREAPGRELDVLGFPRGFLEAPNAPLRGLPQGPQLENPRPVRVEGRIVLLEMEASALSSLSGGNGPAVNVPASLVAKVAAPAAATTAAWRYPPPGGGAPGADRRREEAISLLQQLKRGLFSCARGIVRGRCVFCR